MNGEGPRAIVRITGRALPLRGDDIDTDRIMPARFLRSISFEGLERHLFEDERAAAGGSHAFDRAAYGGATIAIVNRNFGCGSSREHAPQALARWGIRAIVGESFSEIFLGNALMIGLACVAAAKSDVEALQTLVESTPETMVAVDLDTLTIAAGPHVYAATIGDANREALRTGAWDSSGLLLARYEDVALVAGRLPYLSGF